jgi:hypothetical protein
MSEYTITLEEGVDWTTNWRDEHPTLPRAFKIEKAEIDEIMSASGAEGMRTYLGVDDNNDYHLVIVAIDAQGNDILTHVYNHTSSCPPSCDTDSVLNTGS